MRRANLGRADSSAASDWTAYLNDTHLEVGIDSDDSRKKWQTKNLAQPGVLNAKWEGVLGEFRVRHT